MFFWPFIFHISGNKTWNSSSKGRSYTLGGNWLFQNIHWPSDDWNNSYSSWIPSLHVISGYACSLWCWFHEYYSWSTNDFNSTCTGRKPCPNFCIDWDRSRDSISMQRNNGTSSAQVKNTLKVCLLNLVKFKLTKTNLPV